MGCGVCVVSCVWLCVYNQCNAVLGVAEDQERLVCPGTGANGAGRGGPERAVAASRGSQAAAAGVSHALHTKMVVMTYISPCSMVIEWPWSVSAFQKQLVAERMPAPVFCTTMHVVTYL